MSPNPIALVSLLKGKIRTQRRAQRDVYVKTLGKKLTWTWKQRSERGIYEPRNAKDCQSTTMSQEKGMRQNPPGSPQKKSALLTLWFQTSGLQVWGAWFVVLCVAEEPGGLQCIESHRAGRDWAMSTHTHGGGPRKLVCTTIRVFSLVPWFLLHDFAQYI